MYLTPKGADMWNGFSFIQETQRRNENKSSFGLRLSTIPYSKLHVLFRRQASRNLVGCIHVQTSQ